MVQRLIKVDDWMRNNNLKISFEFPSVHKCIKLLVLQTDYQPANFTSDMIIDFLFLQKISGL